MSRRILIFSLSYFPKFVGGAEVAIKEITTRMNPDEYVFDMVTLRGHGELTEEQIGAVHVYRVGIPFIGQFLESRTKGATFTFISKVAYVMLAFKKGIELNAHHHYDAIWSMMANYAGLASMLFSLKKPEMPYLVTLQEGDTIEHILRAARPISPLFKKIFTRAHRIQAISSFLAKFGREMGAECPIEVVPNGVDGKALSREYPVYELDGLKMQLDKKEGDIFLITTSRLVRKNAVDQVIESLSLLPPEIYLIVVGTGPLEDALKAQAYARGVESRVRFVGFVPPEEIPKYLQVSDIFIRPSRSEGFGNSFIEAMAAGLPVIATRVGGIPDFLIDGKTGLFCEVDNPMSIAESVELIIHDAPLRKKIIVEGYAMAHKKYDWSIIARDMEDRVFLPLFADKSHK